MVVVGFTPAAFAALHYWLPKVTGRLVAEGPAKPAWGLVLGGALIYAFAMFFAGLDGQPVDIFRYYEDDGVSTLNLIASIGAFLLAIGVLVELGNLAHSYHGGRPTGHDPWRGSTLEWFALSPPPPHNSTPAGRPQHRAAARHPRGHPRARGGLRAATTA